MKIRVRLFSLLRDATNGVGDIVLEVDSSSARLRDVLETLYTMYPGLKRLVEGLGERGLNVIYMVNGYAAELDTVVRDGDTIALLPPASGGLGFHG